MGCNSTAQTLQDPVRSLYYRISDPFRIGATTTRAGLRLRVCQFGFDIAANCSVCQHLLLYQGKAVRVGIEPMKVAVKD